MPLYLRYSSDDPKFKHSSCMVYTQPDKSSDQVVFGKITKHFIMVKWMIFFLFVGMILNETRRVTWLLLTLLSSIPFWIPCIISLSNVSKPLVYAPDIIETCKVYYYCPSGMLRHCTIMYILPIHVLLNSVTLTSCLLLTHLIITSKSKSNKPVPSFNAGH